MIQRLTEQEREAINKRARLVDENFERTYRGAYRTKYGKDPDAATLAEACRIYYEDNPSAKRATKNVHKSATSAGEMTMIESTIAVNNLRELAALVAKGVKPGMRVVMPNPDAEDGYSEVDMNEAERLLERLARESQGTEEVFSTMPRPGAARFPSIPESDDVTPLGTYAITHPGIVRVGPFAVLNPNTDSGISAPEPFDPSEPMDRHDSDHADINRIERTSPVFKSAKVAKGTFAGTACDLGAVQEHERNTGR